MTLLHRERLAGLKPELVQVAERAAELCHYDIVVLEGMRTMQRQRELLAKGATTILRSKHLSGDAVDLAPMLDTDGDGDREVSWHWPHYHDMAQYVLRAAKELNVDIEWGGHWKNFPDGPHWQLP